MDRFKKVVFPLLMFTLIGILVFSFRSFLMAYFVEPIALLCWAMWRIVSSVNQNIYWVILIVLCTILMLRMLSFWEEKSSGMAYNYSYKPPTRVDYWRSLIGDSVLGKNGNDDLQERLKDLLLTVISQSEGMTVRGAEDIVEKRMMSLSPSARQYLLSPDNEKGIPFQKNIFNNAFFLPGWLKRWSKKYVHRNNSIIDEILNWMETELEINDEK